MAKYAGLSRNPAVIGFVTVLFFLFNAISRYPGIGNPDSKDQYTQALNGHYTDWHPPVMSFLWSVLHRVAGGDGPLYLLHIACYWFGFGLIALALNRTARHRAAWLVLAVGILPPFLMMNVQILKDVGLAVAFLDGFAIIFWFRLQEKTVNPAAAVCASLFMLYGMLVRVNGAFAAAPLLVYMFFPKLLLRPARFAATCLVITFAIIPATDFINRTAFRPVPTHPIRSLELYDLAGVARFSGDMSVFGNAHFTAQQVGDCYSPHLWDTLNWFGRCRYYWEELATVPIAGSTSPKEHSNEDVPNPELQKLWISSILRHPLAYLEHRLIHFNSELYFIVPRHHADFRVLYRETFDAPIDLEEFKPLKWKIMDWVRTNPLTTPVFSLVLNLIVLSVLWPRRASSPSALDMGLFSLSTSALFYMGAYFVIGVSSDIRYHYWSMLADYTAFAICLSEARRYFLLPSRAGRLGFVALAVTVAIVLTANMMLGDDLFRNGH